MIHELGLVSATDYFDERFDAMKMDTIQRHLVFRHCGPICACICRLWALILNIFLDCKTCNQINVRYNSYFCLKFVSTVQFPSLSEEHYFPTADLFLNGMSKMPPYYRSCNHPVAHKHVLKVVEQLHYSQMYFSVNPYFVLLPHADIKMLYTKYDCHHFFFQREQNDIHFFQRSPFDFYFFCFIAMHMSHRLPSLKTRCLEIIVVPALHTLCKSLEIQWQNEKITVCSKCIESKTNEMFHAYLPKAYIDEIIFYVKYSLPGFFVCRPDKKQMLENVTVFGRHTLDCIFKEVCLCFNLINSPTSPLHLTQ